MCGDEKKFPHPFRCGRLNTPLDYTNPADDRNASIAVVFWPAGGGKTKEDHVLGSLLTNPGGPGGSGVDFVGRRPYGDDGPSVAAIYDKLLRRRYNIVSFDPRGIERSLPRVDCFGDPAHAHLYTTQAVFGGMPRSHPGALDTEYGALLAREVLAWKLCSSDAERAELLRHVGTPAVSRDMQLLHRALGDDKINYWGFSYGSVLGATYADMFPQDVNRLVIDGVVNMRQYYDGGDDSGIGLWTDAFYDIDGEFDAFFDECAKAGPEACKLASHSTDGKRLRQKYLDALEHLKLHPLPAYDAEVPQLLTYSQVFTETFQVLYSPKKWPGFASALDQVLRGNPTPFVNAYGARPYAAESADHTTQAQLAIACGDALHDSTNSTGWTIDNYKRFLEPLEKRSRRWSPAFGELGYACSSAWKARSVERHKGSFSSNTSFPILAIGNDFDPVTPGRNADKIAASFPRAAAVRQAGYGHCSVSMTSRCTNRIVRGYFIHGFVPESGTRCEIDADKPAFPPPRAKKDDAERLMALSQEEREEEEALEALGALGEALANFHARRNR
ncbi:hypothetical protein ACQY0O_000585 [Thecaphora frezii]